MAARHEPRVQIQHLDDACRALSAHRKKPVLVLFYPARASMSEDDPADVYAALRAADLNPDQPIESLDVLVESYGGNPVAGYRLGQLIRDFAQEVFFLVPDHAFSAATLLTFSGDEVRLGHFAGLSPIDITLMPETPGKKPREEVELATIDSFVDFSVDARKRIEELLERLGRDQSRTQVDSDLLVSLVQGVGPLQVGKFFRERTLTGHYAQELLDTYMFAGLSDGADRRNNVIQHFLNRAPAHDFHVDYHLCSRWGLKVAEMETTESDLAKGVTTTLNELMEVGLICKPVSGRRREPFFRLYPYVPEPKTVVSENATVEPEEQQP